jgi:hypothetical protein
MDDQQLIYIIRIAYQGLIKDKKGEAMSDIEREAIEILGPVDVTYVLLAEIDRLNQQIIALIEENSHFRKLQ